MKKNILFLLISILFFNKGFSQNYKYFSLSSSWNGQNVRIEEGDTAMINATCFYKGETGEDIDNVIIYKVENGIREKDNTFGKWNPDSYRGFPKVCYRC